MSGSGKQSFYEIQLSNSSLIVAFLVAVGIGVAVFALGVMVGKGQVTALPADQDFVENLAPETLSEEAPASSDLDLFQRIQDPVEGAQIGAPDTASGSEPAAASTTDEVTSPAAQEPAATPPPAAALPAPDLTVATGFVVQVKATPDRAEADQVQAALAGAGFPAFVVSVEVRGQINYRVRVGRYRDRADAERIAAALSQRPEVQGTWITQGE